MVVLAVLLATLTMRTGLPVALSWLRNAQRKEDRERDLLVHDVFRAIEDAVAEQGASPGYRIAPSAATQVETETAAVGR